jgi:ElaB/YqjD/DUF883 family membrane-anchored ribosome-binding protein
LTLLQSNLDSDSEDDILKLSEDVEELVKEQGDASDNEFTEGEFHLNLWRQAEDG